MIKFKKHYLFFIFYFLVAIIETFPLILNLDGYLIGRGGLDGFYYLWNIFSFWNSVSHFQQFFSTKLIFFPIGANLFFSDYSPLTSLFSLPFLNHPAFYLNILIILSLTAAAIIVFFLAEYITKNHVVSFLSGLIYGFSPIQGSFIMSQHYYYSIASVILPLGVLFLLKFFNSPKKYLKTFLFLCWVMFFINYYFFVLLILISILQVINLLIFDPEVRKKIFSKSNLVYYLMSFLLIIYIPMLIILAMIFTSKDSLTFIDKKSSFTIYCNANIAGLITFPRNNLFLSPVSSKLYSFFRFQENADTPYYYLGIVSLAYVFLCLVYFRKERYVISFAITATIILLFSLGSQVRFGSATLLSNNQTVYYWISKIPFLGLIDCPVRFIGGVELFFSLIIAIFIVQILKRSQSIARFLIVLLFFSTIFDYGFPRFEFIKIYIPEVYHYIAGIKDNKTVLELPSGLTESKGAFGYDRSEEGLHTKMMYWETVYKKPRVGGYISRIPQSTYDYFIKEDIISDLFKLTSYNGTWSNKQFSVQEKNKFINDLNLGYIIIAPVARQLEYLSAIEQVLQGIPYEKMIIEKYILFIIRK